MTRLRIVYILSLLAVGSLWALAALPAFFSASPTAERFEPLQRVGLLELEDHWILQVDVINPTMEEVWYTIVIEVDGDAGEARLMAGRKATSSFSRFIYRRELREGRVAVAVYREGTPAPVEEATYFLKASAAPKGQR